MKIFAVDGTETQTAKEKAIELVYTVIGIIQYDENIRVPNYLIPISSRRFALAMAYQARTEIKKQGLCYFSRFLKGIFPTKYKQSVFKQFQSGWRHRRRQ